MPKVIFFTSLAPATAALLTAVAAAIGVRPPPAMPVARPVTGSGRFRSLADELTEGTRILLRLPGPRAISFAAIVQTLVRGALGVLVVVLAGAGAAAGFYLAKRRPKPTA